MIASSGLGGVLTDVFSAQVTIAGHAIAWREIVGNLFGLASAVGGMRRRIWAWPVGIVGNVLLFTVFLGAGLGGAFDTPQHVNLLGQAGRQVMFLIVSGYGWWRWSQARGRGGTAVSPRWATWRERAAMVVVAVLGTAVLTWVFTLLHSYKPVWADAWIFTGSMLATYAMARGWVEFWLAWIAVDVVGVPLLLSQKFYPSAILYLVYGAFVIWGFVVWVRTTRQLSARGGAAVPVPQEVAR